jgi:hypothetical protein
VRRRALRVLLLPLLAALLAACTFHLDVDVDVAKDGSGTVTAIAALDDGAVANVGGDLREVLALDDLTRQGWTVTGPRRGRDGLTTVTVRKPFDHPAGAAAAVRQLSGVNGPFQDFAVTRRSSLTQTRWAVTGTIDLDRGAGVRGAPPSKDVQQLADQLGQSLDRLVQVRVRTRLPGHVESNATTKASNGAVWQIAFGGPPIHLEAHGTQRRTSTYLLLGAGALVVLVLAGWAMLRLADRATGGRGDRGVSASGRAGP